MKIKVSFILTLALLICASYSFSLIDLSIFGPKRYDRLKGAPTVYTDTFERCNPAQFALLKIQNGDRKETRMKAASVYVNGVEVVKENEFKQLVPYIEKTVPVKDMNELKVVLKSGMQDDPNNKLLKEQSFLVIEVLGKGCDDTPPTISGPQPADGSLLNNGRPAISASYVDNAGGTGIDPATASIKVDGSEVTSAASVSASGISYTPSVKLPEGEHTVTVDVSDKAHNSSTLTWRFRTDTTAPSVNITSHINNQYLNTTTIALSGTLGDDPAGNPSGGLTVAINGHVAAVSGNTFTLSNLSLTEGANTITVAAKDPAGNVGTAQIILNLDTISPVVAIVAPVEGFLTNNPQMLIAGSVNEPVTSLTINGSSVGVNGASPALFNSNYTLTEGLNTITVTAKDRAGNTGSVNVKGTLDTIPPTPPVLAALNTPTNISGATITGRAEPGSTVKVFASGNPSQIIGTVNADPAGMFSIADVTLAEGINSFSATATDSVGNTSETSQPVSATLDTKAPAVKITSHQNNQYLNTATIAVTGTVSDDITGNPGGGVTVTVNGHSAMVSGNTFTISNLSLSEGANTITVEAKDPAGNMGFDTIVISLDTMPPVVSVSLPNPNIYLNTPQINVTGSVNEPVTSLTVNGQPVTTDSSLMTPDFISGINLTEGSNTITVTATDRAGNTGTASIAVNLDTVPPTIQVSSPVHNTYVNTPNITVSGTISEPVTSLVVNGVNVGAIGQSPYGFTNGITLTEGENTITISATDPAGNTVTKTLTVTLDTVAPAISVTSPSQNAYADLPNIAASGTVTELHLSGFWVNDLPVETISNSPIQFNSGVTLVPGLNTIVLKAADLAGNVSTVSVTVTLDSTPPVVTITAPAMGSLFNKPGIKVTGTVNEPVTSITVNGHQAVASSGSPVQFESDLTLLEGLNNIVVQAIDRAGNSGTAAVSVTMDTTAPAIPVLSSLTTPTNTAKVTVSGTSDVGSTVKIYKGQTLIGTVTSDSEGNFSIQNAALTEGPNTFTATATDAAGNTSPSSAAVTAVLDTVPPVITVTAPASNSYTNIAAVKVTGSINEDATVTINGTEIRAIGQSPLEFEEEMTLSSGINSIQLTARDAAGNQTTSTVLVTLDQTAPVVTITSPAEGSALSGSTVTISGTINEPVTSVKVNGVSAQLSGTSFILANVILNDGLNTFTAEAVDKAGNVGTATRLVTVDKTPPSVTLSAPSEAAAGSTVSISAGAEDQSGVSLFEIIANGISIWSKTLNSEPSTLNSITYTLSPDLASGTTINIIAQAKDTTGLTGTATAKVTVNQGPTGPGFIQGEVYDDTRGLRLEGANVNIIGATGSSPIQITTGAEGGYFTEVPAGDYLITLSKDTYTTVERKVTVKAEKNIAPLDARLTPVTSTQNLVDSAGGKVSVFVTSVANAELTIPANALTEQADIRLTPVSNQGLINILPKGWSPIATVDIKDNLTTGNIGKTFDQAATLKVPVVPGITLAPSTQVILAGYKNYSPLPQGEGQGEGGVWLVSSTGTASSDGKYITASIPSTGQFAFILPDQPLTSVPASNVAVKDVFVVSVSSVPSVANLSAAGKVKPAAAPPSVGLKAAGEVVITPNLSSGANLVSGFVINAKVTERFDLLSGEVETPSDYIQDIVLYRYPSMTNLAQGMIESEGTVPVNYPPLQGEGQGGDGVVRTTFPISPSRDYTIIELMMGKVGLDITLPQPETSGTIVDSNGARLVDADGNVLNIPQGALTSSTPVEIKTVASSAVSGIVGPDFTLLRAIDVNLGGKTLSSSAELSIPTPSGINTNLPIVIARAIEVKGATRLKLVATATISGSLITSSVSYGEGIKASGVYYVLQAKAPLGFVSGRVTDASNNAYPSALVTSNTCSLVDLTGTDGNYLIASTVAGFTAMATDIFKKDQGTGSGTITSVNQSVTVNLAIKVTPPRITGIFPQDGATGIDPKTSVIITFSEAVDKLTITSSNIYLKDSSGNTINGVFSVNPDGTEVTLYPSDLLKSEATYTVTVTRSIRDMQGYLMGTDTSSTFKIKDTTPPPMPAAGSITGTFPDADGYVTITATQGSAEYDSTVLIINDTTGEIVSVIPNTNGSFTGKIMAQLGDEIKIVLMDKTGNQTLVSYITFKSTDGKYLVTAKGGIVEGEGGTKLVIPEGAFFGPTVVKISPVLEEGLAHPVPAEGKFIGAVNIDTGGVKFQKEVKLSVPAPSGFPSDVKPFLTQPVVHTNVDGTEEKVYAVINSAKVIDGRVTTASPPFDGILIPGMFVFVYSPPQLQPVIVSGHTYINMDGVPGYTPGTADNSDRPVKGAVIRTPAALNFISYSDKDSHYAMFALNYTGAFVDGCGTFPISATHPFTMAKTSMDIQACAPYVLNNLNFKLGEKDTQCPDKTVPAITMNMTVVPGQDARITAGTVNVGTNLQIPISIIDQDMSTVTLTVNYSTPDVPTAIPYSVQVENTDQTHYAIIEGCPNGTMKYTYTPQFDGTGVGIGTYFTPSSPGVYNFILEAIDKSGNKSTKSLQIRATNPGEQPHSVDGAPRVDSVIPADGSKEIMVTMPITAYFNEPVINVNESTFTLTDMITNEKVPAYVFTGIDSGRVYATLQPRGNLVYGRNYMVKLAQAITDETPNESSDNQLLHLEDYSTTFTTKVPQIYELSGGSFETSGSGSIDLFTDNEHGKTYAYIAAGTKGWYVVDVTDPTQPTLAKSNNTIANTDYRGISVEQENGILGITENISFADGAQYGYVRFYDLINSAVSPPIIGKEKLAEAFSGIPGRLAINGNYAYIATVMVGLQVVDIESAKSHSGSSDGSSIVGIYDTIGQGYGSPADIDVINNGTILLTTNKGNLLIIDAHTPPMTELLSDLNKQDIAFRVAGAGGYTFTDSLQSTVDNPVTKTIDIAVVSSRAGKIRTIDITDPYNSSFMGTAKDAAGNEVAILARDIKISSKTGLAFITNGSAIYVIDIKDPYNPTLINTISQTTSADGTNLSLGYSTAIVEKGGWVYLANQQSGLKVIDFDPFNIKLYDDNGKEYIVNDEIKYSDDGIAKDKTYHIELEIEPGNETSCELLIGTAIVKGLENGRSIDISVPAGYVKEYGLKFRKSDIANRCIADIETNGGTKHKFITSNLPADQLTEVADKAVLFAGSKLEIKVMKNDFSPESKTATYNIESGINIAMDGDRDGTIDPKNKADKSYLFWVNDDHDVNQYNLIDLEFEWQEDDKNDGIKDADDNLITTLRELEDFARMHLSVVPGVTQVPNISYHLKMQKIDSNTPAPTINLFEAVDNTSLYLIDKEKADMQIMKTKIITVDETGYPLPTNYITGKVSPFIFEGKTKGKGTLVFTVKLNGVPVKETSMLLELAPIRNFYEEYKVDLVDANLNTVDPIASPDLNSLESQMANGIPAQDLNSPRYYPETNDYIMFVHGYNVSDFEKHSYAETMFKRLWWQGYKGHFGLFNWPTVTTISGPLPVDGIWKFDISEQRGWNSAMALSQKLDELNDKYLVRILAHSHGNVPVGEAIRNLQSGAVTAYIATQAAISANMYDPNISSLADSNITTPDIYSYYYSGKVGSNSYMADNHDKTNLISFYNVDDFALRGWDLNNVSKPDDLLHYGYIGSIDEYDQNRPQNPDLFYKENLQNCQTSYDPNNGGYNTICEKTPLTLPDNTYEIFAYCVQSRSRALGATQLTDGRLDGQLNLEETPYGFDRRHYSHSRQFRSNIVNERHYWSAVLSKFGTTVNNIQPPQ